MSRQKYDSTGNLREFWDDEAQVYTIFSETGAVVNSRPYTTEEVALAEEGLYADQAQRDAQKKEEEGKAILAAIAAVATPPLDGGTWVQPTGAHDAYAEGSVVTSGGKTWISLTPYNVWAPGVSGWREQVAEGYPAWVQPTGGHDAYAIGAKVSFEGKNYESLIAGNSWSPTAYPAGWKVIP